MILVTGGAGLVGSRLIQSLLAMNQKVKTTFHNTPIANFNNPNLIQQQVDILDVVALEELMQDVTEIYHCAALVSFAADDKKKLFNINVEGTANIVNAALHAKVRKIVHVSSVAALGRLRDGAVINETMKWSPETSNSIYGQSKYLGEMEMWRGIAEGLNVVIVNPVIIFGSANWDESSTKIFKSVYEEFPWYTDGVTGFVDVRDVVDAMIILMNSDISGEQFILSAENASYYDVFKMIAKNFGKKPPYKKITPFMSKIVWRFLAFKSMLTGKKPLVTKETTQTALTKANFDNSKLLKFLPTFKYRSLQQTIDDTCAALQQKINKQ